jgi:hypothetical protein
VSAGFGLPGGRFPVAGFRVAGFRLLVIEDGHQLFLATGSPATGYLATCYPCKLENLINIRHKVIILRSKYAISSHNVLKISTA